jgi:hypothetical protein
MSFVSSKKYNESVSTNITNSVFFLSEAENDLRKGDRLTESHSALKIDKNGNVHIYPTMMDFSDVEAWDDKPRPIHSDSVLFRYYYFLSLCVADTDLDSCQLPYPYTTNEDVDLDAIFTSETLKKYRKVWKSPLLGNGRDSEARSIYISSPSLCFLALYAKDLSDIERAAICPIRYGTAEAKLIREHFVANYDLPEPYGVSKDFGYELCEHPLIKRIWTSPALGSSDQERQYMSHCQQTEHDYGVYYMFNSDEDLSQIHERLSDLYDQKNEYLKKKYSEEISE